MTLEEAHQKIASSDMFLLGGPDIDLPQALIDLVDAYMEGNEQYDDYVFDKVGEHTSAPLGLLIVGAWHALTEWHAGQASPEYLAMCRLGSIYKANGTNMTPEDPAWEVYEDCCAWFGRRLYATAPK